MSKNSTASSLAVTVKDILGKYRGLTITVHAVVTLLRDAGFTVTRETVRKHLKDAGCVAEQRGLYSVPAKISKRKEATDEQQPANSAA
jgi:hypothetical protein